MSEVRLIDADALKKAVTEQVTHTTVDGHLAKNKAIQLIDNAPTVNPYEWIPVTTRDYSKKELEDIKKRLEPYGYDTDVMEGWTYTCALPSEDGQEILVSTKYGVCIDHWSADIDGCWFEDHPDRDEVLAWMPLPEKYNSEVKKNETDN